MADQPKTGFSEELAQRLFILESAHAQLSLEHNALAAVVNFLQAKLDRIAALQHNALPTHDEHPITAKAQKLLSRQKTKPTNRVASDLASRIPNLGLSILRNLIIKDLRPYLDSCSCPPKAQRLCDELAVVQAEIARRQPTNSNGERDK